MQCYLDTLINLYTVKIIQLITRSLPIFKDNNYLIVLRSLSDHVIGQFMVKKQIIYGYVTLFYL